MPLIYSNEFFRPRNFTSSIKILAKSRTNFAFIEKLFPHCFEIDLKQSFISLLQSPSIKLPFASSLSRLRRGVYGEGDLFLRKLCKTQLARTTFVYSQEKAASESKKKKKSETTGQHPKCILHYPLGSTEMIIKDPLVYCYVTQGIWLHNVVFQ